MNRMQRIFVIVSLVFIGFALALVFLNFGILRGIQIFFFYERPDPQFPSQPDYIGLSTQYGVPGILLGLIAPLCLFAAAIYLYLGSLNHAREP